jgi:putative toxin-antitoxin system antitoxin component (TIGR02293 family)
MTPPITGHTEAQRIASFLGIGHLATNNLALADCIARGLPPAAADTVRERVGAKTFFTVIPEATYRRVRGQDKPLSRETSEKLYGFGRVYGAVMRIYHGNEEQAMRFLTKPHPLLGGQTALDLGTSSSAGADAVLDLLAQIEAGFPV